MEKKGNCSQPYKITMNAVENSDLNFEKRPIVHNSGALKKVTLILTDNNELESIWVHLVKTYHYLGYKQLLGASIKIFSLFRWAPHCCTFMERTSIKACVTG